MSALCHKETSELKDGESRAALVIYNFDPDVLWRVAVHGLQLAMGEGQGRRHIIHLAAHDFDVGPGFAGASRLHRFIEFAERL
jgi:hypothetical protein